MYICPHCGTSFESPKTYCTQCGTKLINKTCSTPQPASSKAPCQDLQGASAQPTPPHDQPSSQNQSQGFQGGFYRQSSYQQQASSQLRARQILALAWRDYKSSPGWVPKTLILALMSCVPILNFIPLGYEVQWGKTAALRQGDKLPKNFFVDRTLVIGFFVFVINVIFSIVCSILGVFPFIGGWLNILAQVFLYAYLWLALMRMALKNRFSEAFALPDIWEKYCRNMACAMAVFWLPTLIVIVIGILLTVAALLITGIASVSILILGGSLYSLVQGDYTSVMHTVSQVVAMIGPGGCFIIAISAYLCMVISEGANLVVARAFGIYVAVHAPEWANKS